MYTNRVGEPSTPNRDPEYAAGVAWDPAQYLKFAGHRLRPAIDLLGRIDAEKPAEVVDLGAGAGNVTRLLKSRWPDAHVIGVDSSAEMLAKAAAAAPDIDWERGDLAAWRPRRGRPTGWS